MFYLYKEQLKKTEVVETNQALIRVCFYSLGNNFLKATAKVLLEIL